MKRLVVFTLGLIVGLSILAFAQDNFDPYQEVTRIPHIGKVEVLLMKTVNPSEPQQQAVKFQVTVEDQFHNHIQSKSGDLLPHLTAQQISQLQTFMDTMWQKAEDEILP